MPRKALPAIRDGLSTVRMRRQRRQECVTENYYDDDGGAGDELWKPFCPTFLLCQEVFY